MTYITGHDRSQLLLLPEAVDVYVGADNPVRFIDTFVDGLDLAAAGFGRVTPKATGRPAYAPSKEFNSPEKAGTQRLKIPISAPIPRPNLQLQHIAKPLKFSMENTLVFKQSARGLYSYLDDLDLGDGSNSQYDYLGHLQNTEYLSEGHNTLGLEQQIEVGNIPDLQSSGKNLPAQSEPGNISQGDKSGSGGGAASQNAGGRTASVGGGGRGLGIGSTLFGTAMDYASGSQAKDFTGGEPGLGDAPGEGLTNNFSATMAQNAPSGGLLQRLFGG